MNASMCGCVRTACWQELSQAEAEGVELDAAEYSDARWWPIADIIAAKGLAFHPAVVHALTELLARWRLDALTSLVSSDAADDDIASAARDFVRALPAAAGRTKIGFGAECSGCSADGTIL